MMAAGAFLWHVDSNGGRAKELIGGWAGIDRNGSNIDDASSHIGWVAAMEATEHRKTRGRVIHLAKTFERGRWQHSATASQVIDAISRTREKHATKYENSEKKTQ